MAFSRAEEHNGGTIWNIYGLTSGGLFQITENHADFHPTFSPNGQLLAYMYKWGDVSNGQIIVAPTLGGDGTTISDTEEHCAYPTWNWAYDKIAYVRSFEGSRNVYMCDPDGSNLKQLTFSGSHVLYPSWSPDGKRLAYSAFYQGSYELYVVDVADLVTAP